MNNTSWYSEKRTGELRVADLLDLKHLERENQWRLCRGFVFAAYVLLLLAFMWHPNLRRIDHSSEEPYRRMRVDIIEILSASGIPGEGETGFAIPYIPESRLPVFKRPPTALREFLTLPELRGDEYSEYLRQQLQDLAKESARSIAGQILDSLRVADGALPRGPDPRIPLRKDAGLDPGMFRADIIYNPKNKMAAQGYIHIPLLRIEDFEQTEQYIHSLRGLTKGITRLTNITAILDNPLAPVKFHSGSRHFLQIKEAVNERGISVGSLFVYRPPFIYILADQPISINEAERESLKRYLIGGNGILLLENAKPGNKVLREQLRSFLGDVCGTLALEPIPGDHPLYHCFFDFPGGPPEGAEPELGAVPHSVQPFLEGIWIGKRLAAIFSDRGYGLCWAAEQGYDEQVRMGVNLVVYAFTPQRGIWGHRAEAKQ